MSTRLLLGGSAVLAALSLTALVSAAGCNGVLGLNDFSVGSGGGGAGGTSGNCATWAPGNGSCYACAPSSNPQFLNACTNATCVPFDDTRVTKLLADGGLPNVPPLPDAGFDSAPPATDAGDDGGSDGSIDDGGGE